jgi:hypothetical protein
MKNIAYGETYAGGVRKFYSLMAHNKSAYAPIVLARQEI